MALAAELVRHGGNDASLIDALGRQSTDVDKLRGEMIALKQKLASYERAEHDARQRGTIDPTATALTTSGQEEYENHAVDGRRDRVR